jgi:hypothetical protein
MLGAAMGKRTLQTIVGWMIVVGHFGLALFIVVGKDDTWTRDIKQGAILTLSPVTVTYLVAVVKSWIDGQHRTGKGQFVNVNYSLICIVIPGLLIAFLFYTVHSFPAYDFTKPEQLQQWLAAAEVVFGATVGFVMSDLFQPHRNSLS